MPTPLSPPMSHAPPCPAEHRVEHVRQLLALLHAPHEARGLEEALARGGGLGGRGLAHGGARA
ncbi:hypothetical protein, partial [Corallococcus sp. 4LFB]|uniref:hypothetical protein n=1 Tax=Corallococcus sp. 4LFB TaxID=3383249 RepID=UPI003976E068